MKTSVTFSILFWIYTSRAINNESNIYARITINGKKSNISLNQKINIDRWNSKYQRMKGHGILARQINLFLDDTKTSLIQTYRELKNEHRVVTAQLVKARFLGEDKACHSMRDLFLYHNDLMENKLSEKTLCHYKTSQKYILEYVKKEFKSTDIYLQDLNHAFVLGFESFLRGYKPRHYQGRIGNNAVMKHIQRLKKMTKMAYNIEWIESEPFQRYQLKLERTERDYLTDKELLVIENLKTTIERLQTVRDLFVFSCYTGISYADIMELTPNHIIEGIDGNKWIMSKRNKSGVPFKIPLLIQAEIIINKYKKHPRTQYSGKLLPNLSNQKLNSYLKEIADLCKIKKNLTFHMARHTFATTVTLSNGVPMETVSKLLGHTKLTTTQIYARVIEKKISEDMEALQTKLGRQAII
ncbi:site-specific integrase [Gelidibacter sp.]|uniref:site-specific integrase n=1 Tax=Gelidibacter sp. TaxID=2018083 RepID=UPI002B56309E|nr:site-specific integrase [Gelidibacter sp.]HUH27346.1 site-specific integrase [Gelidibacter sp.]